MCRAPIEALAVATSQDRALVTLADGQVNRPGRARDERDLGWLVALADDAEDSVTSQALGDRWSGQPPLG